jgi:pyridinium-3,5-biscarboxylic acid mononucleotide synthase
MSSEFGGGAYLRRLLEGLASGECGVDDVLQRLRLLQISHVEDFARLDVYRDVRKGVPEVVFATNKSDDQLRAIVERLLNLRGLALVSRLDSERAERLHQVLLDTLEVEPIFEYAEHAGVLSVRAPSYSYPEERGCVGILTAGTSDIRAAEEVALVVRHMGCRLQTAYDVGVAGVHRLLEPLAQMIEGGVDVLVVAAGMEGALPSVVAGMVDIPVIGLPTSTGYGLGGDGTAALYSILQSCSPGLVAVNIDNGIGAGAAAALIARRRD